MNQWSQPSSFIHIVLPPKMFLSWGGLPHKQSICSSGQIEVHDLEVWSQMNQCLKRQLIWLVSKVENWKHFLWNKRRQNEYDFRPYRASLPSLKGWRFHCWGGWAHFTQLFIFSGTVNAPQSSNHLLQLNAVIYTHIALIFSHCQYSLSPWP